MKPIISATPNTAKPIMPGLEVIFESRTVTLLAIVHLAVFWDTNCVCSAIHWP
jgi:hypothetical protein